MRANSDDWQSLGLRGNQSGAITFEGVLGSDRVIGEMGEYVYADTGEYYLEIIILLFPEKHVYVYIYVYIYIIYIYIIIVIFY